MKTHHQKRNNYYRRKYQRWRLKLFEINGEQWRIVAIDPDSPELQRSDGTYTVGVCDDSIRTIYVASGLSMVFLKKVLCHEIVHAAMFSYNVDLTLEQEELVADLIATYGEEIIDITNQMFKKIKGDT